jgi:phosphopantothenoylcysteine decarboxylase/phosphopantothenate--cysteine ligase
VAVAPAMNAQMWAHPATRDNIAVLEQRGVRVLGPAHGSQACGDVGAGRMLEAAELLDALTPAASALLRGCRVVVSAGPTFEDIDPVRFVGNRSSGKMGFAIAAAAQQAGAQVTLIAGPVHLTTPPGCRRIDVRSALQMRDAVLAEAAGVDLYVGAAAVADYRPAAIEAHKIKKSAEAMTLQLLRNPDIIAELGAGARPRLLVGFAAETREVLAYAQAKLAAKGLDLIVANRVGPDAAFDREDNAVTVIDGDSSLDLGSGSKWQLAQRLVELFAARLGREDR